ncbi:MAG: hypothetical protein HY791_24505 [Deltaproteobacteria bacterium]|nr:hypothetical protein [Deltaproteobacteria bacterium]
MPKLPWAVVLTLTLLPDLARADARELGDLCWLAPKLDKRRQDREKLSVAIERAAGNTAPDDVDYAFRYIRAGHEEEDAAGARCFAVLHFSEASGKVTVSARRVTEVKPVFESQLKGTLVALTDALLEPVLTDVWQKLAPPPPPVVAVAPEPPPPERKQAPQKADEFQDPELLREAPIASAPVRASARTLALAVAAGLASRELVDSPGSPISGSPLLAIGVDAGLRFDRLARIEGHELEARLGYRRSLATGKRGDFTVSIDADRFDATTFWRYVLGGKAPSVGLGLGYEMLRFELGERSEALSVRWGVLRVGPSLREDLGAVGPGELELELAFLVRVAPGAEGGEASPGFDVGLDARYQLGAPFVRLAGRYTSQSAEVSGQSIGESVVDLDLAVGVAL